MPINDKQNLINAGAAGDFLKEEICNFSDRKGDVVYKNENNAWIVLGRDRVNNEASGYGGYSAPLGLNAGAIDIVVGRLSNKHPSDNLTVGQDFINDSARIYVSQKTDIDDNFLLVNGTIGNSKMRSAVALKADGIRIIGREGVKIVTGLSKDETNSQGQVEVVTHGIDLIAGNFDSLPIEIIPPTPSDLEMRSEYPRYVMQPLVKGYYLKYALTDLVKKIENLSGIMSSFVVSQMDYNASIGFHYHYSPFYGIPTLPSDELMAKYCSVTAKQLQDCVLQMTTLKINLLSFKSNFLQETSEYYINSKYNRTN